MRIWHWNNKPLASALQTHLDNMDSISKYILGCIGWCHKILRSYLTVCRFKARIECWRRRGSKFPYASYGQFDLTGTRAVLKEKWVLFCCEVYIQIYLAGLEENMLLASEKETFYLSIGWVNSRLNCWARVVHGPCTSINVIEELGVSTCLLHVI